MDIWIWWLIIAAALIIAEMFTFTFVLLMLALGSLCAAAVDLAGGNLLVQGIAFALVSGLSLLVLRPILKNKIEPGESAKTGVDALIGRDALVMETVNRLGGLVKIHGDNWSARLVDTGSGEAFMPGEFVVIHKLEGTTLLVGNSEHNSVSSPTAD